MSEVRWKISNKKLRLKTPFIKEIVIDWIMRGWPPDLIAGRIKLDFPDTSLPHEAIYQFIYN